MGAPSNIAICMPKDGEEEEEKYGCTRLQAYWRTHADTATEEYNSAWNAYRTAEFFGSGATYLDVLQRIPMKGSDDLLLAQPYIAAKLNIKSGASTTAEVDEALANATAYFKGETQPSMAELLVWGAILDAYNEGEIGPGRCKD